MVFCCGFSFFFAEDDGTDQEDNQTVIPTEVLISTPRFTNTPDSSPTPTPTNTSTYTPTPTPTPILNANVTSSANLRGGPGTHYDIVGSVQAGEVIPIFARSPEGWFQVDGTGHSWIASTLVDIEVALDEIPLTENIPPTPTTTPTSTSTPTPDLTATAIIEGEIATATAEQQSILNATATIEAYVDSPPEGNWCNQNSSRGVCVGDFRYVQTIGFTRAPSSGRFIAFGVGVKNLDNNNISVSPLDLTLVMDDGRTYDYTSETFTYWSSPLQSIVVAPGDNAQGGIVFLVPNSTPPRRIIYRGGLFEEEIVIDLFDLPETDNE